MMLEIVLPLLGTMIVLRSMGRRMWPKTGYTNIWWTSEASSQYTSQLFADPYTASHVLHGIIFYWLGLSLQFATVLECLWEVSENTPWTINRYRSQTAALGYEGDTVWNSVGDVMAMIAGWLFARTVPWWASLLLCVIVEWTMAKLFRDNLALNIIMLIAPNEHIKRWQLAQ